MTFGEVDVLARGPKGLLLIEVRGRTQDRFRPSRTLSTKKRKRLGALARALARTWRAPIRVELHEWIGELPESEAAFWILLARIRCGKIPASLRLSRFELGV